MQNLQTFIDLLTKGRKLHISILDQSGALNTNETRLRLQNVLHSKHFCDVAKSTEKGFRTCLRCKRMANRKAKKGKQPFAGHCLCGLYEIAFPVVVGETVLAIIYIGNVIIDEAKTRSRIERLCRYTGVSRDLLIEELSECETLERDEELFQMAEIVSDYLKSVYKQAPKSPHCTHWLVSALKRYAEEKFWTDISLKNLAFEYHKNEKYIGRLFKKEIGTDFHAYCIKLRLEKAERLLLETQDKILEIALECGFNNVSYFNRVFSKKNGISPKEYRSRAHLH